MSIGTFMKRFSLFLISAFLLGCSSSDELGKTDQQKPDENGAFQRVDKEEPIIPETDEPVTLEAVEDEDVPTSETPVPMKAASTKETPPTEAAPPSRQESVPVQAAPSASPTSVPRSGSMMWSVQLGAFKSEAGAFQLIEEVKQKFNQPVYKRYDPVTGYYKVTLGSYQTREQAAEFKLEVQSRGYPDAFTVEVAR
ncbi:MAG: SPOR domain-containing protein [Bacteroidetes bacterium]|nr:SPOR domain-containing protein [Bacteroidota bacterium]